MYVIYFLFSLFSPCFELIFRFQHHCYCSLSNTKIQIWRVHFKSSAKTFLGLTYIVTSTQPSLFWQDVHSLSPELPRKFLLYLRHAPTDLPAPSLTHTACLFAQFFHFFIKSGENFCFIRHIFLSFYFSILGILSATLRLPLVTTTLLVQIFHSCLFAPVVDALL